MSFTHKGAWDVGQTGYSPLDGSPTHNDPGEGLQRQMSYGAPASPPRRKPYLGPDYHNTPSTVASEWASPDPNTRLLESQASPPTRTFADQAQGTERSPSPSESTVQCPSPSESTIKSPSKPSPQPEPPVNFGPIPGLFSSWGFEMLSIAFTLGCIIAIIVILSKIDGKPLSSWPIPTVSPNAIISAVSTAAKAAMILPVAESISQLKWLYLGRQALSLHHLQAFDDASRGPWGSLRFFFRSRSFWRHNAAIVPFVGCIVTVAAIAMDPFTQQVLSYEEGSTLVAGARSVAKRSQNYDWKVKGLNGVSNVMSTTRDGLLEAASVSGLYDLVADPPLSCPGSNCTYPTFTSLGISSSCIDVTAKTEQSCKRLNQSIPNQVCDYVLPSGFELGSYAGADAHNGFFHTLINSTVNSTMYTADTQTPGLVSVGIVRFDDGDLSNNFDVTTKWQDTLAAWECQFSIVAYAYHDWVSLNGTIKPGTLTSSKLNRTGMGPIIPYEALDGSFPGNNTFNVNYYDMGNMASMLNSIYSSSGSRAVAAYSSALYNSANLTETAANIARGMSYRMLAGPNATEVYGDVYAVQTFMRVHWRWLALMATLVVITVTFFAAVVVETRWQGQRAWKSSLVPMLYGGHDILMRGDDSPSQPADATVVYSKEGASEGGGGPKGRFSKSSLRVSDRGGGVWEVEEDYHLGRTQKILGQLK